MKRKDLATRAKAASNPVVESDQPDPLEPNPLEDARSARKGKIFLALAILLIIAVLIGGLLYQKWHAQSVSDENRYNGFGFTQVSNGKLLVWVTRIQVHGVPYDVPFYYHPRETENVLFERGVASRFLNVTTRPTLIYVTFDESDDSSAVVAAVEVSRLLGRQYDIFNIETHSAFKRSASNSSTWPIVTCADATIATAVLSFDLSTRNMVRRDATNPYCIRVEYTSANDSIRVADRFAYALLQIMPG